MSIKISQAPTAVTLQTGDYIPFSRAGANLKFDASAFVLASQVYIKTATYSKGEVDQKFSDILGSPPAQLDTIAELANAYQNNADIVQSVSDAIGARMAKAANGADILDPAAFRTSLGLGSAALHAATEFMLAGANFTWLQVTNKPTTRDGYGLSDVSTTNEVAQLIDTATAGVSGSLPSGGTNGEVLTIVSGSPAWQPAQGATATTLAGYGITDAYTKAQADTAANNAAAAAVAALTAGSPTALDTFIEVYNRFLTDESAANALNTTVAGKMDKSANLSDIVDKPTARTNLGLGTAALAATGDFAPAAKGLPNGGTNGQVLTVVSGAAAWATPAAGGATAAAETIRTRTRTMSDFLGYYPTAGAATATLTNILRMNVDCFQGWYAGVGTGLTQDTTNYYADTYGRLWSNVTLHSGTTVGGQSCLGAVGMGYAQNYVAPMAMTLDVVMGSIGISANGGGTNAYWGVGLMSSKIGNSATPDMLPSNFASYTGHGFGVCIKPDNTAKMYAFAAKAGTIVYVDTGLLWDSQTTKGVRIVWGKDGTGKVYASTDLVNPVASFTSAQMPSATEFVAPRAFMVCVAASSDAVLAIDAMDFQIDMTR